MCTGANSGNVRQGPYGPSYNVLNPRRTVNQYEEYMRKDLGPGGQADAGRALQRSIDEQAALDVPTADTLTTPAVDNRATGVQRRKPRSLLSLAGGGGDTSTANVGGGSAKAVLGA